MTVEVLDFHAEWCGPCKQQDPILEELEEEYDEVEFTYIDIEENADAANKYGIQSIPTLVIRNDDTVEVQLTGLQQKDTIAGHLDELL